jgi:hypothetical protein
MGGWCRVLRGQPQPHEHGYNCSKTNILGARFCKRQPALNPEERHAVRRRPRSRHHVLARTGVRPRRPRGCQRAGRVPPDLPAARLGRARPRRNLVLAVRRAARRARQGRHRRARPRGHRHHEPARDHDPVGPRHRQAGGQRDRVAGPAHREHLRRAARGGARPHVRGEDGARRRRVLLRHQAQVAARPRARRASARRARRARVRHRRLVARLEPDGRHRPRHRRVEREPHAALRHPSRRLGRCAVRAARRAARGFAERCRVVGRVRAGAYRGRGGADRRHRGRPAGCTVRSPDDATARPTMHWRAACSSAARSCSGCATG